MINILQPLEVLCKKGVVWNFAKFTGKRETLAQVFSYEFCKISKNTFFKERLWATASVGNCFGKDAE